MAVDTQSTHGSCGRAGGSADQICIARREALNPHLGVGPVIESSNWVLGSSDQPRVTCRWQGVALL